MITKFLRNIVVRPLRRWTHYNNFPIPRTTYTTKTTIEQKKIVWKWFDLSSEWFSSVLNIALPIQMMVWLHRNDFGTKINWSLVVGIKIFTFFPLFLSEHLPFIRFHYSGKDIPWICIRTMVHGSCWEHVLHIWIEKQYVERKICIVITSEHSERGKK